MKLKTLFVEQLKKDQYFGSFFSYSFRHPVDAVNFWKFCDLHYPYEVVTKTDPTTYVINFEERFAMAILEDLIAQKKTRPSSTDFVVEKKDFIKDLTGERFTCTMVPAGFSKVDDAINFWTFCDLSYPYTLVKTNLSFRIVFEQRFGSAILSDLTRADKPKKTTCFWQIDDSEMVPTPCVFPQVAVVEQKKKRPFPKKATCFFPTFELQSQPQ